MLSEPQPIRRLTRSVLYALGTIWAILSILAGISSAHSRAVGGIDLRVYEAAARAGLRLGWDHIYDAAAQRPFIQPYFVGDPKLPHGYWSPYVTPPPIAWLVAPLTRIPFTDAWAIWTALMAIAVLVAAWALTAGGAARWFAALLALMAVADGVVGVAAGNVGLLVLVFVALSVLLSSRGRYIEAGLVLGLAAIKPQLVLLVVPALLAAGYWRMVFAALGSATTIGVLSLASLGWYGLGRWAKLLREVQTFQPQQRVTLRHLIGNPALDVGLTLVVVGLTLYTAWAYRRLGSGLAVAVGLLGSLMVSPYLNGSDYIMLAAAAVILVQLPLPLLLKAAAGLLVVGAAMVDPNNNLAPDLAMITMLASLALLADRPRVSLIVGPRFGRSIEAAGS